MLSEKSLLSKQKKIKDESKKTINLQKFKGAESHLDTREKNIVLAHSQADIRKQKRTVFEFIVF